MPGEDYYEDSNFGVPSTPDASVSSRMLGVLNGLLDTDPALGDQLAGWDQSASANARFQVNKLLGLTNLVPGGRLTLTTAVPVTTADVTGATTIYYTPYLNDMICLWDGTRWIWCVFTQTALALGTLTSGKAYDVFGYLSSGVLALELLAWTNDTTRATAINLDYGRYCKNVDETRLYLGSFYTTSTTATEDSVANRYVWNMYNRVARAMKVVDTTDSWTYITNTWRAANGSASGNRINMFRGLNEDSVLAQVCANLSASVNATVGIGISVTNANSAQVNSFVGTASGTGYSNASAIYVGTPGLGKQFLQWLEIGNGGTCTFYGDAGTSWAQCGLTAQVMA